MHHKSFGGRALPCLDPLGELTALPRPRSWIKGVRPAGKGAEKRGGVWRKGKEGKGREEEGSRRGGRKSREEERTGMGKEKEGKGGERKGKGGEGKARNFASVKIKSWVRPWSIIRNVRIRVCCFVCSVFVDMYVRNFVKMSVAWERRRNQRRSGAAGARAARSRTYTGEEACILPGGVRCLRKNVF